MAIQRGEADPGQDDAGSCDRPEAAVRRVSPKAGVAVATDPACLGAVRPAILEPSCGSRTRGVRFALGSAHGSVTTSPRSIARPWSGFGRPATATKPASSSAGRGPAAVRQARRRPSLSIIGYTRRPSCRRGRVADVRATKPTRQPLSLAINPARRDPRVSDRARRAPRFRESCAAQTDACGKGFSEPIAHGLSVSGLLAGRPCVGAEVRFLLRSSCRCPGWPDIWLCPSGPARSAAARKRWVRPIPSAAPHRASCWPSRRKRSPHPGAGR